MRLIRKMQTAAGGPLNYDYLVQSDNTRVVNPYVVLPFTTKLWEQELLRRNLERRRQAVVTSDNRSTWLKQQDLKKAKKVLLLELEIKNQEAAAKAAEGLMRMASPSTYLGFAMGNIQGTGTGSLASDFLTDALVFGGPSLIRGGLGYLSNSGYRLATKPAPWRNYTFGSFMPLPSKVPTLSLSFLVASYPGYLLKGLMTGSQLEKLLSKVGTIDINQLNAYFNKASQLEREVVNKVLTEKFAGLKTIDYNLLKKAVLDELIGKYNRVPLTEWADYGIESLGYNLKTVGENELPGLPNLIILGLPVHYTPPGTKADPINLSTFTFESPRILYGNTKHYGGNPIGHSRTYTLPEDPHTLYVMESQSDWAQAKKGLNRLDSDYYENNLQNVYNRIFNEVEKSQQELNLAKKNFEKGLYINGNVIPEFNMEGASTLINTMEKELAEKQTKLVNVDMILHPEKYVLENYLKLNYLLRLLQENLRYAAENGLTKMRYPTSETAAKIEGYLKKSYENVDPVLKQEHKEKVKRLFNEASKYGDPYELYEQGHPAALEWNAENQRWQKYLQSVVVEDYAPEYRTILKKYADFPKLFLKLYKGRPVRTVIDTKGNTWYEVDVPENYLNMEWQFKQGGKIDILQFLQKGDKLKRITVNKTLPEITVVPLRLYLETYYPVVSEYPFTGHSAIYAYKADPEYDYQGYRRASIDKTTEDAGYNLVTNNCADATRCALEAISGKKMNPYLSTTPGDVLDFFKQNFEVVKDKRKSEFGSPVYYTNISEADFDKVKELQEHQFALNRDQTRKRIRMRLLKLALKLQQKIREKKVVE